VLNTAVGFLGILGLRSVKLHLPVDCQKGPRTAREGRGKNEGKWGALMVKNVGGTVKGVWSLPGKGEAAKPGSFTRWFGMDWG